MGRTCKTTRGVGVIFGLKASQKQGMNKSMNPAFVTARHEIVFDYFLFQNNSAN